MFWKIPAPSSLYNFSLFASSKSSKASKLSSSSTSVFLNLEPNDEQIKINKYIERQSQNIDYVISLQNTQIEKLKEYKTTLINSAVTGKIKIEGNADDA